MELEFKTIKPSRITWKTKQSSLESKHSSSNSLDVVNEGIFSRYQKFQESTVNLGSYRVLGLKCKVKDESEDDQLGVVNDEVHENLCKKIVLGFCRDVNEWNLKIMSISNNIAPQDFETSFTDPSIIQEQVDHDQVIAGSGYCSGIPDHDEQDDEEQEIMGVVGKPSRLKNLLYLILTVSSLILCFLPRVYGDKIPNLFLPCPLLFYGFNLALMLAAVASLVSIDATLKKVANCFSDLAILFIFTALALFLFSSFLWARSLWAI